MFYILFTPYKNHKYFVVVLNFIQNNKLGEGGGLSVAEWPQNSWAADGAHTCLISSYLNSGVSTAHFQLLCVLLCSFSHVLNKVKWLYCVFITTAIRENAYRKFGSRIFGSQYVNELLKIKTIIHLHWFSSGLLLNFVLCFNLYSLLDLILCDSLFLTLGQRSQQLKFVFGSQNHYLMMYRGCCGSIQFTPSCCQKNSVEQQMWFTLLLKMIPRTFDKNQQWLLFWEIIEPFLTVYLWGFFCFCLKNFIHLQLEPMF